MGLDRRLVGRRVAAAEQELRVGLALAAVVKGYKCIFVTTDKQSKEKADIL